MIMKKAVTLVFLFAVILKAQVSVFNATLPFGIDIDALPGGARSMGGTGNAVVSPSNMYLLNPGNLGLTSKVAFSASMNLSINKLKEAETYTDHADFMPELIGFSIPLDILGTAALSFRRLNSSDIRFRSTSPWAEEEISISTHQAGGTNAWEAGWGRRITDFLGLGMKYQKSYSNRELTRLAEYSGNESGTSRDSTYINTESNSLQLGILMDFERFSGGITFTGFFNNTLEYSNGLYNRYSGEPVNGTTETGKYDFDMPYSIGLGFSFQPSSKFTTALDLDISTWERFDAGDKPDAPRVYSLPEYRNTISISGGLDFVPNPEVFSPDYWEMMHFYTGFNVAALPVKNSAEYSGTLGIGLPVGSDGIIDLGFEAGRRT
ncbi:MAG: conjugal transfer protein TraF, partial [Chitinivibrionales bacterium]